MSMFEHAAAVRRQRPSTENRTRPRGGCVYGLSSKCGLSPTQESAHICCGLIGDLLLRNVSGIGVHDELRASDRGMECIRGLYRDGAIVFTPQDQSRRLDVWNVIPNSLVPNPAAGDRRRVRKSAPSNPVVRCSADGQRRQCDLIQKMFQRCFLQYPATKRAGRIAECQFPRSWFTSI